MMELNRIHACPNISFFIFICNQYCGMHSTCLVELCLKVPNYPMPVAGISHPTSIDQYSNDGMCRTVCTLLGCALGVFCQTTPLQDQHTIPFLQLKVPSIIGKLHSVEPLSTPEIPAHLPISVPSVAQSRPCSPDRRRCEQTTFG